MAKRRRGVDDLVDLFRGKIEDPRDFFERVLTCKYKHEDRSSSVIPYRSVIEFYLKEQNYLADGLRPLKKTGTDADFIEEFLGILGLWLSTHQPGRF